MLHVRKEKVVIAVRESEPRGNSELSGEMDQQIRVHY